MKKERIIDRFYLHRCLNACLVINIGERRGILEDVGKLGRNVCDLVVYTYIEYTGCEDDIEHLGGFLVTDVLTNKGVLVVAGFSRLLTHVCHILGDRSD